MGPTSMMNSETTQFDSKATKPLDTLLVTHYQAIRDEILARMGMRQTVLTVYLGFIGTILGLAVAAPTYNNISILVPFITFGVFWIIRDHELAIAHLGCWIKEEYLGYLKELGLDDRFPRWQDSPLRQAYGTKILSSRYITYLFVFVGSSGAGLVIAGMNTNVHLAWIIAGAVFTVFTAWVIFWTLKARQKVSEF